MSDLFYAPTQQKFVDERGYLTHEWREFMVLLTKQVGGVNSLTNAQLTTMSSSTVPPVFLFDDGGGSDDGGFQTIPGPSGSAGGMGQSGFGVDGADGEDGLQMPANHWPQGARGTAAFTNGVGVPVLQGFSSTGGTGASTYTLGDIVLALKTLGILAA